MDKIKENTTDGYSQIVDCFKKVAGISVRSPRVYVEGTLK